ncbi:nicotinate-nucleotide adenylyltransferase [Phosphitispora sp. TUW77]|uniref:nicotinate-nucleotide adenylyltransferase n=1 Tax=Phosphitispora sp. TUW77 TaxID=3152361 RepID=UPI003AB67667
MFGMVVPATANWKKIGIMGGTFDPIHYGHLHIAECSRHRFGLEKVIFVPAGNPVHKSRKSITSSARRMEMTALAIRSNPNFDMSEVEVRRSGPTYTVDTLEELHREGIGDQIFFITGADAILEILTWKNVVRVFELCEFIAITRPGYSFKEMDRVLTKLTKPQRDRIHFNETGGILISSTDIRRRVLCGEPIKYLVPPEVEGYINENGLYFPEGEEFE